VTLEVRGLWKSFATGRKLQPQSVLRSIDLTVNEGEFVSLIGHSGCGKSTLLNLIGGLQRADAGTVMLDGELIRAPGPDRSIVFQHYSLLPRLSLLENVRTAVRSARPDRAKPVNDAATERYLTAVGLWEHRNKRPGQVSGGMQQRVAVARAFAVEPRLLLLDEPFGALDALTRARLQAQLVELWQSESQTEMVVMVTHGIDEAILLSDRIVVMMNPPGPSIVEEIPVTIPRPRDRVAIVDDPHFRDVQQRLLDVLHRPDGAVSAGTAA
jgi:nitrate ABC transporter ATP-binding subunit